MVKRPRTRKIDRATDRISGEAAEFDLDAIWERIMAGDLSDGWDAVGHASGEVILARSDDEIWHRDAPGEPWRRWEPS